MRELIILAALFFAGAAQAAAATPSAPVAAKPPQAAPAAPRKIPGVSDEGNAILAKAQAAPDPQLQNIVRQLKAAHDQLVSAVMAPVIDVDKITVALRAEEAAQALARTHNNDRLIAVIKQLPDEDRGTFLRVLLLSRQQRPSGATPQP